MADSNDRMVAELKQIQQQLEYLHNIENMLEKVVKSLELLNKSNQEINAKMDYAMKAAAAVQAGKVR